MTRLLVGIFVGGAGRRMGGVAKGLLTTPDAKTTLIERLRGEILAALPDVALVLVGDAHAYSSLGLPAIADDPANVGPLGGLAGLLAHAQQSGAVQVLALACDLPQLERSLLARLAREPRDADAVLVEQAGVRNPLIARYETSAALPAARRALGAGKRSLQAVLDELEPRIVRLELSTAELASLGDWDTPDDIARDREV